MSRPDDPRSEFLAFARAAMIALFVLGGCFVLAAYGLIDELDLAEDIDQARIAFVVFCAGLVPAALAVVSRRLRHPRWETMNIAATLAAAIVLFVAFCLAISATVALS